MKTIAPRIKVAMTGATIPGTNWTHFKSGFGKRELAVPVKDTGFPQLPSHIGQCRSEGLFDAALLEIEQL